MTDPLYANEGSVYVRIAEEASEVAKAALKAERFGGARSHPERNRPNLLEVLDEFEDLRGCIEELREEHLPEEVDDP